jgi:hypothetical protein
MFGSDSLKTMLAAGALAVAAGGVSAATVTYENVEDTPKVRLVIDDSGVDTFRFTLTTTLGFADFLGLAFDFAGSLTEDMITLVSYTPDSSLSPDLELFGDGVTQVDECGAGCNFKGGESGSGLYDYIVRIGEQGGGDKLISSIVFDIALAGSLDNNPFSNFAVRAQGTSNEEGSIKYGLEEAPPIPLPAAGFLMIGALVGLAALRRRRRA